MRETFILIKCDAEKEKQIIAHLQSLDDISEIQVTNESSDELAKLDSKTKRELTLMDIFFSVANEDKKELELGEKYSTKTAMKNFHKMMMYQSRMKI